MKPIKGIGQEDKFVFKFLLKKINSLHQNEIPSKSRKKIGFK